MSKAKHWYTVELTARRPVEAGVITLVPAGLDALGRAAGAGTTTVSVDVEELKAVKSVALQYSADGGTT